MKIPKKYLIQEKKNRGKLNQTALQVELKTNDRGQPHPKVKGLVLIRYTSDRENTQKWGIKDGAISKSKESGPSLGFK